MAGGGGALWKADGFTPQERDCFSLRKSSGSPREMLEMKSGRQVSNDSVHVGGGFYTPRMPHLQGAPWGLDDGLAAFSGSPGNGLRTFTP